MIIRNIVVSIALFSTIIFVGSRVLDRPTVEISVDTGHCVRAYGPNGPMSCEDAMNGDYESVIVYPKRFKKVLQG